MPTGPKFGRKLASSLTRDHRVVFLVALVAQAWILALPFQFDDFVFLVDPLAIFAELPGATEDAGDGGSAYMMRWTLWAFWAIGHALSPEPLSPVPFHATALLLHAATAWLLARVVTRLAPAEVAHTAGLVAGLFFATAMGGIQAVSWASAQSDLLFPFFALLALRSFLDARERAGARRRRAWAFAFAFTVLTLWSKAPAFLVPALLFGILVCVRPASGERRSLLPRLVRLEALLLAAALGVGFFSRWLYLGTIQLRYERTTIDWSGLVGLVPKALAVLRQAVYPWNRHEVFVGEEPLSARALTGELGLPPQVFVPAALLLLALAAIVRTRRIAGPLALAALLAFAGALAPALIYSGQATNVIGRTTYFPLVFVAAGLGLAVAAVGRDRRALGFLVAVLLGLVHLDVGVHVWRTERLAALYQETARDAVAVTAVEHELSGSTRPLVQLVVLPDNGLGGVPALGYRLEEACRPPFYPAPGLDVRVFRTPEDVLEALGEQSLAHADVRVHGREWAIEPAVQGCPTGADWRELLAVRPWTPLRLGLDVGAPLWSPGEASAKRRSADPPVPAHALAPMELTFRAGPAETAELRLLLAGHPGGELVIPIQLPAESLARRVALLPYLDLDAATGAAVEGFEWTGRSELLVAPLPLAALPEVELLRPAPDAELSLTDEPFAFRFAPPTDWTRPAAARLELRQLLPRGPRPLYADARLDPTDSGPVELRLDPVHLHAAQPPASPPPPDAFPWPAVSDRLRTELETLARWRGQLDWRATLHHPQGHLAARSPRREARLQAPGP